MKITMQGFTLLAVTDVNFDENVDGRTNERTHERMNGRTEIWTPLSHPALNRFDNKNSHNELNARPTSHLFPAHMKMQYLRI